MKRRVLLMKRSTADMFPNAMQRDTKNKAPILHIWREGTITCIHRNLSTTTIQREIFAGTKFSKNAAFTLE